MSTIRIPNKMLSFLKLTLIVILFMAHTAPLVQAEQTSEKAQTTAEAPAEKSNFFVEGVKKLLLLDHEGFFQLLKEPGVKWSAYILVVAIIFTETGLLVGVFLPGDSLLVTIGLICSNSAYGWDFWPLMAALCAAAVIGDTVGYSIGYKTGPKIFSRENSLLFHKNHLIKAQEFYDKHGGKTIIIARFMPILRTFAPVVAGIGKMDYRRFVFYNVFGGVGWVCSMMLVGYLLPSLLNPVLQPFFGAEFRVEKHVEKVILIVVFLSIAPGIYVGIKNWLKKRKPEQASNAEPVAASK